VPSGPLPAKPCRNHWGDAKNVSLFMEVEDRFVINFFVEEGTNAVEIIERLNKHYGEGALKQTQVDIL
jgi:hypothetical protein